MEPDNPISENETDLTLTDLDKKTCTEANKNNGCGSSVSGEMLAAHVLNDVQHMDSDVNSSGVGQADNNFEKSSYHQHTSAPPAKQKLTEIPQDHRRNSSRQVDTPSETLISTAWQTQYAPETPPLLDPAPLPGFPQSAVRYASQEFLSESSGSFLPPSEKSSLSLADLYKGFRWMPAAHKPLVMKHPSTNNQLERKSQQLLDCGPQPVQAKEQDHNADDTTAMLLVGDDPGGVISPTSSTSNPRPKTSLRENKIPKFNNVAKTPQQDPTKTLEISARATVAQSDLQGTPETHTVSIDRPSSISKPIANHAPQQDESAPKRAHIFLQKNCKGSISARIQKRPFPGLRTLAGTSTRSKRKPSVRTRELGQEMEGPIDQEQIIAVQNQHTEDSPSCSTFDVSPTLLTSREQGPARHITAHGRNGTGILTNGPHNVRPLDKIDITTGSHSRSRLHDVQQHSTQICESERRKRPNTESSTAVGSMNLRKIEKSAAECATTLPKLSLKEELSIAHPAINGVMELLTRNHALVANRERFEEEVANLNAQLERVTNENGNLRDGFDELSTENEYLNTTMKELADEKNLQAGKIEKLTKLSEQYREHINEVVKAQNSLEAMYKQSEKSGAAAKSEAQLLMQELKGLKTIAAQLSIANERISDMQGECNKVRETVNDQEKELSETKDKLEDKIKANRDLDDENTALWKELEETKSRANILESCRDNVEPKVAVLVESLTTLQRTLTESITDRQSDFNKIFDSERTAISRLDELVALVGARKNDNREASPAILNLIGDLRNKLEAKIGISSQTQSEANAKFFEDVKASLEESRLNCNSREQINHSLNQALAKNATLSATNDTQYNKLKNLQAEHEQVKRELTNTEAELAAKSIELSELLALRKQYVQLAEKLEDAERASMLLQDQIINTSNQATQLREHNQMLEEAEKASQERIQRFEHDILQNEAMIKSLQEEKKTTIAGCKLTADKARQEGAKMSADFKKDLDIVYERKNKAWIEERNQLKTEMGQVQAASKEREEERALLMNRISILEAQVGTYQDQAHSDSEFPTMEMLEERRNELKSVTCRLHALEIVLENANCTSSANLVRIRNDCNDLKCDYDSAEILMRKNGTLVEQNLLLRQEYEVLRIELDGFRKSCGNQVKDNPPAVVTTEESSSYFEPTSAILPSKSLEYGLEQFRPVEISVADDPGLSEASRSMRQQLPLKTPPRPAQRESPPQWAARQDLSRRLSSQGYRDPSHHSKRDSTLSKTQGLSDIFSDISVDLEHNHPSSSSLSSIDMLLTIPSFTEPSAPAIRQNSPSLAAFSDVDEIPGNHGVHFTPNSMRNGPGLGNGGAPATVHNSPSISQCQVKPKAYNQLKSALKKSRAGDRVQQANALAKPSPPPARLSKNPPTKRVVSEKQSHAPNKYAYNRVVEPTAKDATKSQTAQLGRQTLAQTSSNTHVLSGCVRRNSRKRSASDMMEQQVGKKPRVSLPPRSPQMIPNSQEFADMLK